VQRLLLGRSLTAGRQEANNKQQLVSMTGGSVNQTKRRSVDSSNGSGAGANNVSQVDGMSIQLADV
jgi:hypothetical protein